MKFAVQTISWGCRPSDIHGALEAIGEAGFKGIELCQQENDFPPGYDLIGQLDELQLDLVGISGGTLEDKLSLAARLSARSVHSRIPYVYADEWDAELDRRYHDTLKGELSYDRDVVIAIHPHMFKPIQTASDATSLVSKFQYLQYLPDTAHLFVAGEDVLQLISEWYPKLAAVHLKDWSPEFGRTFPYYSRGFVELGKGRVPVADVLKYLANRRYDGWIVIEQDSSPAPITSAIRSYEYIKSVLS